VLIDFFSYPPRLSGGKTPERNYSSALRRNINKAVSIEKEGRIREWENESEWRSNQVTEDR
jgi:hypothetical protein